MTVRKCAHYLILAISMLFILAHYAHAADYETLARKAETEGKLRAALTHYVSALQSVPEGNAKDRELREKIIRLSQKLQPLPAVPEEAERHMLRGEAAIEMAKDNAGFQKAAKEFKAALRFAPWMAEGYFNLFVAQENAEDYSSALRNARFYLQAAPGAPDADAVRKQIVKLEYKLEQTVAKEAAKSRERAAVQALSGTWNVTAWTNFGIEPSHPSEWPSHSIKNQAKVTVRGNSIQAEVYGGLLIFRGSVDGTNIRGQLTHSIDRNYPHDCPPGRRATYDAYGTIWPEDQKIMIVVPAMWKGPSFDPRDRTPCVFQADWYGLSVLLRR